MAAAPSHLFIRTAVTLKRLSGRFLWGACSCTLAAGCTAQDAPRLAVTTRDSAGIRIVQHASFAPADAPVFEVVYLAKTPNAGSGEFGSVADVEVLANGDLAVLDRFTAQVKLFSPDGTPLATIGRRGRGPGELSGGASLGILRLGGSRFAVPDVLNRAFVVFRESGEYLYNLPFDVSETAPEWRVLRGDTVVTVVQTSVADILLVRTLDGEARDTIAVLPTVRQELSEDGRVPIISDQLLWSATGSGNFVTAHMSRPSITLFEGNTPRRVIRWEQPGRTITRTESDILLGIASRVMGDPTGDPETARDRMAPPVRLPAIADVELGTGIVLVQQVRKPKEMDRRILSTLGPAGFGGSHWDIFSWDGHYIGVLDFGSNVEVFGLHGDTIVGVKEDSLGTATAFLARLPAEQWQALLLDAENR